MGENLPNNMKYDCTHNDLREYRVRRIGPSRPPRDMFAKRYDHHGPKQSARSCDGFAGVVGAGDVSPRPEEPPSAGVSKDGRAFSPKLMQTCITSEARVSRQDVPSPAAPQRRAWAKTGTCSQIPKPPAPEAKVIRSDHLRDRG